MNVCDFVDGKTKVFGIIGNPVNHSFSPVLQNTIAQVCGINIVYTAFNVEKGKLHSAVKGGYDLGIQGFNVTVPYKREVIDMLCGIDDTAEKIGAVNTLKRTSEGYFGYNTDVIGLYKTFNMRDVNIEGKNVTVVGAGGAANSAVILAGLEHAAKINIINRTAEKAEMLKNTVQKSYNIDVDIFGYEDSGNLGRSDIIIQTTSVGMGEGCKDTPIENADFFKNVEFVVDVIYTPFKTRFLEMAENYGAAKTANGFDMLVYQGIASFEIWNEVSISNSTAKNIRDTLSNYYCKVKV